MTNPTPVSNSQFNVKKTEINQFGLPNIVIPAEILFNPEISWRDKALFGLISNLTYNEKGYCWASNANLAKLMDVRADTMSSSINKLEQNGYLNLEYLRRPDGNQVRKIYINKNYMAQYGPLLEDIFSKLTRSTPVKRPGRPRQSSLGENSKPPRGESNSPKGKVQSNIDIDIDIDLKDSLSDPSGSESVSKLKRTNTPGKIPIKIRNKQYLPIAKELSQIIREVKNINPTPDQMKKWTDDIRKLVEGNKVTYERIQSALDWYADNIGGQYVPVIECGHSLRNKFGKLEDAIKRGNGNGKSPKSEVNYTTDVGEGYKKPTPMKFVTKKESAHGNL
jgi:hypothetical protein